jgi:uncharacterized repeat protein (TIGR02543 family)
MFNMNNFTSFNLKKTISLLIVSILISSMFFTFTTTTTTNAAPGDTWTVTFNPGTGSYNDPVSVTVPEGTLINNIAPNFFAKPGWEFNGWSPTWTETDTVTANREFTAQWIAVPSEAGWANALNQMSWIIPAEAIQLKFTYSSINDHTFINHVYLETDDEGNAFLYFLASSDSKSFEHPSSYFSYAGLSSTIIDSYDAPTGKWMYRVIQVDIPYSLIVTTIIHGNPLLYAMNENNPAHSIAGVPFKFTNINYQTEHWVYDELGPSNELVGLTLRATIPGVGVINQHVTAKPINILYHELSDESGLTIASGYINDVNGMLTLKLYYKRSTTAPNWFIRSIVGSGDGTTIYNGKEQSLADVIGDDITELFDFIWPSISGAHFVFAPAASSGSGVYVDNPHGTVVGTYTQDLRLVPGYKVLYRVNEWTKADIEGEHLVPVLHIDPRDGVEYWWGDITDDIGPAGTNNGVLEITARPITVSTGSDKKSWDGSALTKDLSSYTSGLSTTDEGLLDDSSDMMGLPHIIEIDVIGSQTDPGVSNNEYENVRIYYNSADYDYPYEVDVTLNYNIIPDLGLLIVMPVIIYDSNEGTGTMTNTIIPDDWLVTLDECTFTRDGYQFDNWATSSCGSEEYADKDHFSFPATLWENLKLYARWTANTVDITYKNNFGGSDTSTYTTDSSKYDALLVAPTAPTREGYAFDGWFTDSTCTDEWNFANDALTVASGVDVSVDPATLTLYAQWTLKSIVITLDGNSGNVVSGSSPITKNYGEAIGVALPTTMTATPTRTGYTFTGWNTLADGTGKAYDGSTLLTEANGVNDNVDPATLTLYAQWSKNTYSVTFRVVGGTWADATVADKTVTFEHGYVLSVVDVPVGMLHSVGYSTSGYWNSLPVVGTSVTKNLVFIYTFGVDAVEDEFLVWYDGNGATGGSVPWDDNWYVSGESVFVMANTDGLARTGYSFLGWAYSRVVTAADFVVGGSLVSPDRFTISDDDVVLYAVWSPISYTVTYEPGAHGTFAAKVTSGLRYGDQTPVAPTVTGETGWNFTGWLPVPSATVTGDATYVAQWTQISTTTTPLPTTTTPPTTSPPTTTTVPTTTSPTATPIQRVEDVVVPPPAEGKWALVNLILSILGVVFTIIAALFVLLGRKPAGADSGQGAGKGNQGSSDRYFWRLNAASAVNDKSITNANTPHSKINRRWLWWFIVAVVLTVVGVVVFLRTEDMSLSMGFVDKWTIVNVVVFVVVLVVVHACIQELKFKNEQTKPHTSSTYK